MTISMHVGMWNSSIYTLWDNVIETKTVVYGQKLYTGNVIFLGFYKMTFLS